MSFSVRFTSLTKIKLRYKRTLKEIPPRKLILGRTNTGGVKYAKDSEKVKKSAEKQATGTTS